MAIDHIKDKLKALNEYRFGDDTPLEGFDAKKYLALNSVQKKKKSKKRMYKLIKRANSHRWKD